jgi:hypothetical protein
VIVAFAISGFAFVLGALAAEKWGPAGGPAARDYPDLWIIAGAFFLVAAGALAVAVLRERGTGAGSRLPAMASPGASSPPAVAQVVWEIADKALSVQTEEWKDLRVRVATLAALGPAAAVVIVTATSYRFDFVALLALVFLGAAVAQSIVALYFAAWRSGFDNGPRLLEPVPAGTEPETLRLALTGRSEEIRHANFKYLRRVETMFFSAAGSFLLAVLAWSIHAAANTHVFFKWG